MIFKIIKMKEGVFLDTRRDFYKKISNNSLKNIKTRRTNTYRTRQERTYSRNNYSRQNQRNTYKNGMIRFEEEKQSSSFLGNVIILACIVVGGYYILDKTNPKLLEEFKENISIVLPNDVENVLDKFKNVSKNEDISIDEKVIEDMEQQIEKEPKK